MGEGAIDHCLIEKVLSGNALRIRTSDFNVIQNCVIRDKIKEELNELVQKKLKIKGEVKEVHIHSILAN